MENLADYSNYVKVAYIISALVIIALMAFVMIKYFSLSKKNDHKKST
ncbi:MAG: hypothetical protein SFV53_06165 [Rickettsiales bacterium]|nr:hypothetical protein [Rickettsiales bacterium]